MIADKIEPGVLVFPRPDASYWLVHDFIGVEKHDDLVDALTMAIIGMGNNTNAGGTVSIGTNPIWSMYGPHGRARGSGRSYWNRRLDDWNQATSDNWD